MLSEKNEACGHPNLSYRNLGIIERDSKMNPHSKSPNRFARTSKTSAHANQSPDTNRNPNTDVSDLGPISRQYLIHQFVLRSRSLCS